MSVLRSVLTYAFWGAMVPFAALIGFPWTFLTGKIDFLYRFGCWIAITGVRIAGIHPEVIGRNKLDPQGTYIFMSNHVSNLDPPMLIPLIPRRTSVLAKKELFNIPILGRGFLMGSFVPVDRNNREAAKASLKTAAKVLQSGVNLTIFPEGTRSPDGRLLPFKKGPFFLAKDAQVPVVPITILNTERLWPKGSPWLRSGSAIVVFHAPLNPADYANRHALTEAIRQHISSALPPECRTTDDPSV
ncbi:MAG: lysophospholipid acyltransferase family protein [Candidatus Korobacteraceae bacterium]